MLFASADLVGGLERESKTSTETLKANMSNHKEIDLACIDSLGKMRTNGVDPKLDEKLADYIMQIHVDSDRKETEQAERIVVKNNTDSQLLIYGFGLASYAALLFGISKCPKQIDLKKINFNQMGNAVKSLFSKRIGK